MAATVLIVEDEAEQAEILREVVEGLGHRAFVALDSRDAEPLYRSLRPDLVVLDMVMPDADGFEVMKALGAVGCRGPLLLVSGYNPHYLSSAQAIAAHYGIDCLSTMQKPLHIAGLRDYLRGHLAAG